MKYKGKKGIFWLVFLIVMNSVFIWGIYIDEKIYEKIIICIAFILADVFCVSVTVNNYVLLEDNSMLIVFGFIKRRIKYSEILSIVKQTHNPISSTALTLDRMGIKTYEMYYLISIKDKEDFLKQILKKNSQIVIK